MNPSENVVPVQELHTRLGVETPIDFPESSLAKSLVDWKMEIDDSPIFRYIYRHVQPRRHLEYGTWLGNGALYCLEECNATVWTINLYEGETEPSGRWAYQEDPSHFDSLPEWARKTEQAVQTDSFGFIGKHIREKGYGHRVCHIFCDSMRWDQSNYPSNFFDTVLVDGGHTEEIVTSDTLKALDVLKPGGIMMWHDFCPDPNVLGACSSTRGVMNTIRSQWPKLNNVFRDIFWIKPSWILLGIKRD